MDSGLHYQGQNFAPLAPLQKASETNKDPRKNNSSFCAVMREIAQELLAEQPEFKEQIETARAVQVLRAGKLVLKRDTQSAGYVYVKPVSGSAYADRSNYPLFPQNSETLKAKWLKSSPVVAAAIQGDGYRQQIVAADMNRVVRHYFKRIFNKRYELNEALSAQDYGTYITQFCYDDKLNQQVQLSPIIQQSSKVIHKGYQGCLNCAHEGTPDQFSAMMKKNGSPFPQCPECESTNITRAIAPQVTDSYDVTGVDTLVQGDITGYLRSFAASRFDPRGFVQDSEFFLYQEYVPLRLVHQMFGERIGIQPGDSNDIGLELMEALAGRGGNIEGQGVNNIYASPEVMFERTAQVSMWLKPSMYAGIRLPDDEETAFGTIPANVPLEQLFPESICVTGFNEMNLITGVFAEKANAISGVYYIMSHSGYGKGVSDSVDIAKDLNEIHSMAMAGLKRFGASGVYYDQDAITPEQVRDLFKPNKAVPVDLQGKHIDDINKVVGQLTPPVINPALGGYAIQLSNLLNMAFMTGDFTDALVQDVNINTLGGQQLAHAKTEEQRGAILTMKAYHREEAGPIIIDLFRQNIKFPAWFRTNADRHGSSKQKMISGATFPSVVIFDAVPDSEIPVTPFEKSLAKREMVQDAGGIAAIAQVAMALPKLAAWYAEGYGVELPMLDENEIETVCLGRVDQIKQLADLIPDAQALLDQLSPPLDINEWAHQMKAEFLQQILDDDEANDWNPVARVAVNLLIDTHYDMVEAFNLKAAMRQQRAQILLAKEQAAAAMEIQQPVIQQQAAIQQQQAQQQNQMQQDNDNQAFQREAAGQLLQRNADETQNDMQHERDMEKLHAQQGIDAQSREHQAGLDSISADKQHSQNLTLEKMRLAAKSKTQAAPSKKSK